MSSYYPIQPELVQKTYSYRELTPNSELNQDILFYYEFEPIGINSDIHVIPDACQDVMFYMGKDQKVVLGNTPTTRGIYSFTPKGKYFGVRLNPKQTVIQYNCALKQIVQQPFVNVGLGCTLDSKFIQAVFEAGDFEQRVQICNEYFCSQKKEKSLSDEIFATCFDSIIENNGLFLPDVIQHKTGYSERYIRELFYKKTGFGPKKLSKFIRIQLLLQHFSFEETPVNIDQYGYYDPSHYYKEFKSLLIITPAEYIKEFLGWKNIKRKLLSY